MEVNYVDAAIDGAMSFGCSLLGSSITKNSVKTAENTISKGINRIASGIRGYNSHTGNYGRNLRRGLIFSFTPKKNTSKRNSTYMINCSHRDVIDWRLTELEYYLRRYYRMNDVPTSCSNIYLWRIGKKVQDEESLDNIADLRYGYFIRERLVHKIPLEMICLLVAFAISIFKIKNEFISIAIGILLGSRFVWNTFMLFDLVKKRYCIRKRINE